VTRLVDIVYGALPISAGHEAAHMTFDGRSSGNNGAALSEGTLLTVLLTLLTMAIAVPGGIVLR